MILPEEIENQQFEVGFRGYNTREVDEFLNKIRMDIEEMVKEQEVLRKKVAAAELIAKDAKDHEEDFIASMQADKDASEEVLAQAKAEGERIIREAKNAATGIMTEVRRRAGEISAESRKSAQRIAEEAHRRAAEITAKSKEEAVLVADAAKAAAEEKIYSARTEADNIVKAAKTHARAIEADAKKYSEEIVEKATASVAVCEEYITEIRKTADSICHEVDMELKNSAARISLLGKRIASMNISAAPAPIPEADETELPAEAEAEVEIEVTDTDITDKVTEVSEEDAPTIEEESSVPENTAEEAPVPEVKQEKSGSGGYFTEEYRQVMEELFGGDMDLPDGAGSDDDDDTYDYLDRVVSDNADTEDGNNELTSEYSDISPVEGDDLLDVFSNSALDRIYKAPSAEDIQNIMNEY